MEHRTKRPHRKSPLTGKTLFVGIAIVVAGFLALTAIQFAGNSGWSKDVKFSDGGSTVRLQFKSEQSDGELVLAVRVRDQAGFLMQVSSVTLLVMDSDQSPVHGPVIAQPVGEFSTTGDGQYVRVLDDPLPAGIYDVESTVRDGSAVFRAVWPVDVK